ncbi:anther-specific protein LAT52-like [Rhododendron vialii]|uniref:anther-specific protein LAT52-like n=1 Tax=Rhododendron vialii TaxID=182163 RepID=UPI00265F22DD|nr:anther-specific protein LAT52-like [Rhododendron vialii]
MAKVVALIASALCILALAGFAQSQQDEFVVKGQVYCDTCRVLFQTKLSKNVAAAGVELKCRSRLNDTETLSVTSQTDQAGAYEITVKGDREDDICEVHAVHSPLSGCVETAPEISSTRVSLAENTGMKSKVRYANPIGFRGDKADSQCTEVLDELGLIPELSKDKFQEED